MNPVFSDAQFQNLADHLETEFPGYGGAFAESFELDATAYVEWLDDNAASPEELKKWRKHYQEQADAIWTVIMGLHDTSMLGMRDNTPEKELLYRYSDCLNAVKDNTRKRGAPKNTGRANLIKAIYDAYGPNAIKTEGSHFEESVAMVLKYLEPPPVDIHKTILSALK